MKNAVKLAVVGCGGISKAHVRGYADLFSRGCREFEVTACCDINEVNANTRAEEIAAFQGTPPQVFTDVDAMIQAEVAEAADVCLPHAFHHTVGVQLLENGLHAMIEKPLGLTVKASKRLIEAADTHERVLATGENVRRYLSSRAFTWAITEEKMMGDILLANIQSLDYRPSTYESPAAKWRGIKLLSGGGMIMDSGAHFADMVQVLFGEVDEVYCTMDTHTPRLIKGAPIVGDVQADVEDTWHAVIRFTSGLHVLWTYSRALHETGYKTATYYGSMGTIRDLGFPFHPFQGGGTLTLSDQSTVSNEEIQQAYMESLTEEEKDKYFPYGTTDGFAIEVWDFVNAIANGRKPEMDGHDGLRAKALCECCYESATIGAPVKFTDVLKGKVNTYQKPIDEFWKL